eukprot:Skav218846  [mRNA]  locus=scaffold2397:22611:29917:+ [translate_table: standard]
MRPIPNRRSHWPDKDASCLHKGIGTVRGIRAKAAISACEKAWQWQALKLPLMTSPESISGPMGSLRKGASSHLFVDATGRIGGQKIEVTEVSTSPVRLAPHGRADQAACSLLHEMHQLDDLVRVGGSSIRFPVGSRRVRASMAPPMDGGAAPAQRWRPAGSLRFAKRTPPVESDSEKSTSIGAPSVPLPCMALESYPPEAIKVQNTFINIVSPRPQTQPLSCPASRIGCLKALFSEDDECPTPTKLPTKETEDKVLTLPILASEPLELPRSSLVPPVVQCVPMTAPAPVVPVAQQWQLVLDLGAAEKPRNAISRSTAAAACGGAGQMRQLRALLQQLEEEKSPRGGSEWWFIVV